MSPNDEDTKKVNKSAKTGEFVSKEEAEANPDTTFSQTVPVNKDQDSEASDDPTQNGEAVEFDEDELQEQAEERAERENAIDSKVSDRTARYDQDLKERARTYGINPDNFAKEEDLGKAVKAYEDENGILGTPSERDQ